MKKLVTILGLLAISYTASASYDISGEDTKLLVESGSELVTNQLDSSGQTIAKQKRFQIEYTELAQVKLRGQRSEEGLIIYASSPARLGFCIIPASIASARGIQLSELRNQIHQGKTSVTCLQTEKSETKDISVGG